MPRYFCSRKIVYFVIATVNFQHHAAKEFLETVLYDDFDSDDDAKKSLEEQYQEG